MSNASAHKLRTSFRKSKAVGPLHTSGPFAVTSDGGRLVTCVNDEVLLTDVETTAEVARLKKDDSGITALAISPSDNVVAVFYASLFLRIYEIPSTSPNEASTSAATLPWQRQIARAHDAPVHVMVIDPTSSYLASGAADGHVKVWDLQRGYVTHSFPGHGGVVSVLYFHIGSTGEGESVMTLVTGSLDTKVRMFNLTAQKADPVAVLDGHTSVPRGVAMSTDGRWLVSGGRDSVILLWDLQSPSDSKKAKVGKRKLAPKLVNTIPALERVEALGLVTDPTQADASRVRVFTAGEKGVVRIWDAFKGEALFTLGPPLNPNMSDDMKEQMQIMHAVYLSQRSTIVTLHADQNIKFHSTSDGSLTRQLIGFNDEIIDAVFLSPSPSIPDSHIATATNSSFVRVYSTSTLDARLLESHTDMVLCLDRSACGRAFVSGSKDKSARIWSMSDGEWSCVAVCEGHTESVGAVAFSRRSESTDSALRFMFTGSLDRTVKMWDLSSVSLPSSSDMPLRPKSLITQKAHDKDVNSMDVSPNDRLLATGSQDKTAKIFEIQYSSNPPRGELKLVGTLKGHKRGVWNVRFSKVDRIVATASGDKTVKLWSLEDYTCLKTFEGHTNSILRVEFLNRGMQLVTAAADGLVKVWSVKDEECLTTLDNHEDKVWALAISADEKTIVSAAADSVITFWQDSTELELEEKQTARAELVLKEQDFLNYVSLQDYRNAILLALSMDQPGRLLSLFTSIRPQRSESSVTGNAAVDEIIRTLPPLELVRLLRHIRNWNANNKTYAVAQTVLHAVLKLRPANDILEAFEKGNVALEEGEGGGKRDKDNVALKDLLDALIPYTTRHFNRAEKMVQDSYVVDYILHEMDSGLVFGNGDDMDIDSRETVKI